MNRIESYFIFSIRLAVWGKTKKKTENACSKAFLALIYSFSDT